MAERPHRMRKTRFVCISDTHNATSGGSFKLPKGDVLIHAGDLTNQGSYAELQKAVKWIEDADFEQKIVIAGNHDITLDTAFYEQYGLYFHNQNPQDAKECQKLLEQAKSITYLNHHAAVIKLVAPDGPRTTFKVFGSPYSPAKGRWAFGYSPEEANQIWDKIPLDTDISVTHTPPKFHLDERADRRAAGCEDLRCMLWRVRPRLAICGHVHEGRGAERVQWDLGMSNIKYKEIGVKAWTDPGLNNKKMALVDLTAKGGRLLLNDGATGGDLTTWDESGPADSRPIVPVTFQQTDTNLSPSIASKKSRLTLQRGLSQIATSLLAVPTASTVDATRGQGGIPPSLRCDLEALWGRLERKETCVVNAAIMASSWPHKGIGGRKFNKPIVVDIDMPCWEDE